MPILGNVVSMMREPPGEDCFIRWSKQYGPVYSLSFFIRVEFPQFSTVLNRFSSVLVGRRSGGVCDGLLPNCRALPEGRRGVHGSDGIPRAGDADQRLQMVFVIVVVVLSIYFLHYT